MRDINLDSNSPTYYVARDAGDFEVVPRLIRLNPEAQAAFRRAIALRSTCALYLPAVMIAHMNLDAIVQSIDAEIDRLERARSLLTGQRVPLERGAPAPKRTMSPEGRARVAAVQRARWAKAKRG